MWKTDQAVAPTPERHVIPERPVINDLGQSVSIKGDLSGSEDLTLYGRMEGRVSLPEHLLTVGPQAAVKADIAARAVVVKGTVTGNVTAAEKLEIQSNGSVLGDVISPRLVIADGGSLQGKVEMKPKS